MLECVQTEKSEIPGNRPCHNVRCCSHAGLNALWCLVQGKEDSTTTMLCGACISDRVRTCTTSMPGMLARMRPSLRIHRRQLKKTPACLSDGHVHSKTDTLHQKSAHTQRSSYVQNTPVPKRITKYTSMFARARTKTHTHTHKHIYTHTYKSIHTL